MEGQVKKSKIKNQFLVNYILIFFIFTIIALFAFKMLVIAGDLISKNFVKNNYKAKNLILDDYKKIEATATKKVRDAQAGSFSIHQYFVASKRKPVKNRRRKCYSVSLVKTIFLKS